MWQRYLVESSDVLQDLRINISEEKSGKVLWYTERYLTDTEIVENIIYSPNASIIPWSIHRPKRGWYIRLRSSTFPPDIFIHLKPMVQWPVEGALRFVSRTFLPLSVMNRGERNSSSSSIHSYPPTPPSSSSLHVNVQPPTPALVESKLAQAQASSKTMKRPRKSQISHFVLSPSYDPNHPLPTTTTTTQPSILSRAWAMWSQTPASNRQNPGGTSFTLTRLLPLPAVAGPMGGGTIPDTSHPPTTVNPSPVQPSSTVPSPSPPHSLQQQQHNDNHLLKYTNQTPIYSVSSQKGLIEINEEEESSLGVETSFWVAVAIAYSGFLAERESYLAAMND